MPVQLKKIQLDEVKPSSRISPFIRFDQSKKLHRQAVVLHELSQGFDDEVLFDNLNLQVEAEERVAIIGPNGIGKTTLLRTLMGELSPMSGHVKWTDSADIAITRKITPVILKTISTCLTGWGVGPLKASKWYVAP